MSILAWIILGGIAGIIASKIVDSTDQGILLVVGAAVAGYVFSLLGTASVTGFNLYSMVVAIVGAVIVLMGYPAVAGRRSRF